MSSFHEFSIFSPLFFQYINLNVFVFACVLACVPAYLMTYFPLRQGRHRSRVRDQFSFGDDRVGQKKVQNQSCRRQLLCGHRTRPFRQGLRPRGLAMELWRHRICQFQKYLGPERLHRADGLAEHDQVPLSQDRHVRRFAHFEKPTGKLSGEGSLTGDEYQVPVLIFRFRPILKKANTSSFSSVVDAVSYSPS